MKKIVALGLAFVMALTLASCTGKFATVQDYINNPVIRAIMDKAEEDAGLSETPLTITAEGNALIYTYTFEEQIDAESAKPTLETALEQQASQFESVAAEVAEVVLAKDPKVVIRYVNPDGSEIYSRTFTADK